MRDTCLLGDVPIRQMHVWEYRCGLFIDAPADYAHVRRITQTPGPPLDLVLLLRSMKSIMAALAESDEIVRAVPSRLAGLDMMNLQDGIF